MAQPAIEILVQVRDEASTSLRNIHALGRQVADAIGQQRRGQTLLDDVARDSRQAATDLRRVARDSRAANDTIEDLGEENLRGVRTAVTSLRDSLQQMRKEGETSIGVFDKLKVAAGGLVSGLGFAAAVQESRNFGKAIAETSTLVDSAVTSNQQLAAQVSAVAREFGTDRFDTAKAQYQALSSGARFGAESNDLLRTSAKAAIAGVTDLQTSVEAITKVINAYGLEMTDAEDIADIMFTTVAKGVTNFGQLSASIGEVAPVAASMGISFQEISAALVALTKQTGNTATSVTKLRDVITSIATSQEAITHFQKLGFASAEAAIKQKGLTFALQEVQKVTGGSVANLQKMLGSIEAVQAATIIAADGGKDFAEALGFMDNRAGALNTAFDKMENILDQDINKAMVRFKEAIGAIGDTFAPAISIILNGLSAVAESLASFISQNQTAFTIIATALGAAVTAWTAFSALRLGAHLAGIAVQASGVRTALAGLVSGFGQVTTVSGALTAALGGLTTALAAARTAVTALWAVIVANPLVAAIGVIVAGAVAIYNAYSEWQDAEESLAEAQRKNAEAIAAKKTAIEEQIDSTERYKDVTIQAADAVATSSLRELKAYRERLTKAKEYAEAQRDLALHATVHEGAASGAYYAARTEADKYSTALEELTQVIADMEKQAEATYIFNNRLITTFNELEAAGKSTKSALSSIFADLDFTDAEQGTTVIQALGTGVEDMGVAFQDAIRNKTIPDLIALKETLDEQLGQGLISVQQFEEASSQILRGLFAKVGVQMTEDLQEMDTGFIAAFDQIIATADTKGNELVQIIESGLSKLKTGTGLDELKRRIDTLYKEGKIDALEYARLSEKVASAKSKVTGETDRLKFALDSEKQKHEALTQALQGEVAQATHAIDMKIRQVQASRDAAQAIGDEEAAIRAEQQILDLEAEKAQVVADAKQKLAEAAQANASEMQALAAAIDGPLNQAQENLIKNAQEAANALTREAEAAQQAADAASRTARAGAEQAGANQKVAQSQQQVANTGGSLMQFMINYLNATKDYLSQYGDKVVAHFEGLNEGMKKASGGAATLSERIDQAKEAMRELSLDRIVSSSLGKWFIDVAIAARRAEIAFLGQAQRAQGLANRLSDVQFASRATTDAMMRSVNSMDLLDDATLNQLRAQIESVRQATESLNSSINSTLNNLLSELDRARGNLVAVEERNYRAKEEELNLLLAQAQEAGDQQMIDRVRQAIQANRELHSIRMEEARQEEGQQQRQTNQTLTQQGQIQSAVEETGAVASNIQQLRREAEQDAHNQRMANEKAYQDEVKKTASLRVSGSSSNRSSGGTSGSLSFASGGQVSGPGTSTSDSILARLSHGEWVMDARTVKFWGGAVMRALQLIATNNRMSGTPRMVRGLPAFASGGPVSQVSNEVVQRIDRSIKRAGGGSETIQVEIVQGQRTVSGQFPVEEKEDLLAMLDNLQARA